VNRKVWLVLAIAVIVVLVGRAHRPHGPALPFTAGNWTAAQSGAGYVETGSYGNQRLAMTMTPSSADATLDLTDSDPARLPGGDDVAFHGTFDDHTSFAFGGDGSDLGTIHSGIDSDQMADWIRHLAGGGSLVISFDDQSVAPLVFPLAGAGPTLNALGAAIRRAGGPAAGVTTQSYTYNTAPGAVDAVAALFGMSVSAFFFVIALLYFLPAVLGYARRSAYAGMILLLNVLLGWTVLGWWILLAFALFSPARGQVMRARIDRLS
jgi:hypothetical protein